MKKIWGLSVLPVVFLVIIIVFILSLFLIKILWAWTIPDLFPGAVREGLIARSISWFTALKLAIFIAILSGITGITRSRD